MTELQPAFGKSQVAPGREAGVRRPKTGFWHQPVWMDLVSDILILVSSVTIGYAAVRAVVKLPLFSLHEVFVMSPLGHVTREQLEIAANSSLRGNFFTIDLDRARSAFETLPWVRKAQLRRRWPGAVEVMLEEHQAVAYWRSVDSGDTRLVDTYGELFDAAANADMPVFSGPVEAATTMLAQMYRFNDLLKPLGRRIAALTMSGRHAWQLRLDDGLVVDLGKDQPKSPLEDRLARFVKVWPRTQAWLGRKVASVDLRYESGFAVRPFDAEQRKGTQ